MTLTPLTHQIRFPTGSGTELSQDEEWCEVLLDGEWRRIRFHDYGDIYAVEGLYEHLFYVRLRDQLTRAQVVEAEAGGDAVGFGSEVTVSDRDSGKERTYTLVSAVDADAAAGRLSVESPVAQALVGARAGDVIEIPTPKGKRTLEVIAIA